MYPKELRFSAQESTITSYCCCRSLPKLDMFIRQIFSTCPPCGVIFPASFTNCYFDGVSGELKLWNEQKAQSAIPLSSSSFVVTKEVSTILVFFSFVGNKIIFLLTKS